MSGVKRRAAASQFHISVYLHKIRPYRGNLPQMAVIVVKVQETLCVNVPLFYKVKLLATERVKGVSDLNSPLFFLPIGCTRQGI